MIIEQLSGNRIVGFYRGIVKKHLSHGRCKIYIPSVYDKEYENFPDGLPTAEPATPLFAGTNNGNGCFSYPNLGSIVWCFFANDDANFPVFFAASLGGENAFGLYDIIKKSSCAFNEQTTMPEDVSRRHLITSGKTHVEWYENGKLSAIVEDPIRTYCSADYTDYYLQNDNTIDQLSNLISNYNISAISLNKLSNIDCQIVLDNDANSHGELSARTHWYNIIAEDKNENTTNGIISIDNTLNATNDGIIKFGTLSTLSLATNGNVSSSTNRSKVRNYYKLAVPGQLEEEVRKSVKKQKNENNSSESLDCETAFMRSMDTDVNANISGSILLKKSSEKNNNIDDLTHLLTNAFSMTGDGNISVFTQLYDKTLNTNTDNLHNKTIDSIGKIYTDVSSNFEASTSLNEILIDTKIGENDTKILKNKNLMTNDGTIELSSFLLQSKTNTKQNSTLRENGLGIVKISSIGKHLTLEKYNLDMSSNAGIYSVANDVKHELIAKEDSAVNLRINEVKTINNVPFVDIKYANLINAATSTANIQIIDNISNKEHIDNVNVKAGITETRITDNKTGNHCFITMDSNGNMTIDSTYCFIQMDSNGNMTLNATSTVNIKAPGTSIDSDFVSINAGMLDVTCKGDCTVNANNVNFSGKVAVGAGATGTITNSSVVGVVNGIVTSID